MLINLWGEFIYDRNSMTTKVYYYSIIKSHFKRFLISSDVHTTLRERIRPMNTQSTYKVRL